MLMFDGPFQVLFYAPLFRGFWRSVWSWGCVLSKSLIKHNDFRILFKGGPCPKKYPNFDFWFSPLRGPGGTLGALRVRRIIKLNKTKSDRRPILGGSLFKKIVKFQNFGGPPASPAFRSHFLGPWAKIKILLPTFCLPCWPDSDKVPHNLTAPLPLEEIDLAETPF